MATNITTAGQPAAPVAHASIISALHARYEAAWAEYNRIELAQPAEPDDTQHPDFNQHFRCKEAMDAKQRETDALRVALLYQTPIDREDAAILAYQLWSEHDIGQTPPEPADHAFEIGLTNLFDYLAGEVDTSALGKMIGAGADIAMARRRIRSGQFGEEA